MPEHFFKKSCFDQVGFEGEKVVFFLGQKHSFLLHGLIVCLFSQNLLAGTTHVVMDPSKRLSVAISEDSMNRIAVVNDRITQVFGDSEAYETQSEETTGQIFIKPLLENGDKPLSLTLITEKNITQDLTLLPTTKEAATVILKPLQPPLTGGGEGATTAPFAKGLGVHPYLGMQGQGAFMNKGMGESLGHYAQGFSQMMIDTDPLIEAMKHLTSTTLPALEGEVCPKRNSGEEFSLTFVNAYQIGSFKGLVYTLQNASDSVMELKEERFYTQGDLALCLEKYTLKAGESTQLYVLTRCVN